jgi:hypothetical protein
MNVMHQFVIHKVIMKRHELIILVQLNVIQIIYELYMELS